MPSIGRFAAIPTPPLVRRSRCGSLSSRPRGTIARMRTRRRPVLRRGHAGCAHEDDPDPAEHTPRCSRPWIRRCCCEARRLHRGLCAAPGCRRPGGHGSRRRPDHGRGQGERCADGARRPPTCSARSWSATALCSVPTRPQRHRRVGLARRRAERHDFVGSYGRVFDVIVLARPGDEWQSPSMALTLRIGAVRKRTPRGASPLRIRRARWAGTC